VVVMVATAGAAPLPKYLQGGPNQLTSRAEQLPSPQAQPAPSPQPALAVPAGAPATPPPRRIMLVGDSLAESLLDALKAAAAEQGAELYPASVPGCGILGGQPIDLSGAPFKWSATYERDPEVPDHPPGANPSGRRDLAERLGPRRPARGRPTRQHQHDVRTRDVLAAHRPGRHPPHLDGRPVVAPTAPSDLSPDPPKTRRLRT